MKGLKVGAFYYVCIVLIVACFTLSSFSAPVDGEVVVLEQPNMSQIQVKVWGDEFYTHVESPDGFTVVRDDKTGYVCYAEYNSDKSELVSSGIVFTGKDTELEKIFKNKTKKSIKLDKSIVSKKVKKSMEELFPKGDVNIGDSSVVEPSPTVPQGSPSTNPYYNSYYNGTIAGLTILIDFPDEGSTITPSQVNDFCNGINYTEFGNNGSVNQYFKDVSGNSMNYQNVVPTYYYTAINLKSYYTDPTISYGTRARELAIEAINYLSTQGFDFSVLSKNKYGQVRALNLFYVGGRDNAWAEGLWPHSGSLNNTIAGIPFGRYQITNMGTSLSIGTFCHENGHMICEWADTYDYDYDSKGTGRYDLMSSGGSTNPVVPNPYFRNVLCGWGDITLLNNITSITNIGVLSNQAGAYCLTDGTGNEFFMLENVENIGRWSGFGKSGLYIWHGDKRFNVYGGNNYQDMTLERHYQVSVEQADGLFNLEYNQNYGDDYDAFYQGNKTAFGNNTIPSSKWWDGTGSGLEITDVSGTGSNLTFNVVIKKEVVQEPFKVIDSNPLNLASNVARNTEIKIYFNDNIAVGNNFANIGLKYSLKGKSIAIGYVATIANNVLTLKPSQLLPANTSISVVIPENAVVDTKGATLSYSLSFKTARR